MLCADARAELHLHAGRFELATEVAQRLVKLFLAGHALGHVELAADFASRIEQFDGVTTLGEHSRGREAGRGGTDDGDAHPVRCRGVVQLRSEEHTSELQSLMRTSYAVSCLANITDR